MRITTRLDKEAENNTEIIQAALRHYADLVREDAQSRNEALRRSGFVGCFPVLCLGTTKHVKKRAGFCANCRGL